MNAKAIVKTEKLFAKIAAERAEPVTAETKLSILWDKIKGFVLIFYTLAPRKAKPYFKYFIAKIDRLIEIEEEEGEEPPVEEGE